MADYANQKFLSEKISKYDKNQNNKVSRITLVGGGVVGTKHQNQMYLGFHLWVEGW